MPDEEGPIGVIVPEGAVLKKSDDYALVVLVDHNGVADAKAMGVSHKQAAEWLRAIADMWDKPGKNRNEPHRWEPGEDGLCAVGDPVCGRGEYAPLHTIWNAAHPIDSGE